MTEREQVLAWCRLYCNNPLLTDWGDFTFILDKIIEAMTHAGITSETMGGMSQNFAKNEGGFDIHGLLSPYKHLKMI